MIAQCERAPVFLLRDRELDLPKHLSLPRIDDNMEGTELAASCCELRGSKFVVSRKLVGWSIPT